MTARERGAAMKSSKRFRRFLLAGGILCAAFGVGVFGINQWIVQSTRPAVYQNLESLPDKPVALVLGTAKLLRSGRVNPHFRERIRAAAALYHAGKVQHLLLSGDNHAAGYDEPSDMREALLAFDVPESAMTLDYAGFRTLDSVVRARRVFGLTTATIVTDDFHAARAVFLARHEDLDAVAYCSASISKSFSARTRLREVAARVKAALDIYILHTQPRFLGEPVSINLAQPHRAGPGGQDDR